MPDCWFVKHIETYQVEHLSLPEAVQQSVTQININVILVQLWCAT
jgi:hypothetical protein